MVKNGKEVLIFLMSLNFFFITFGINFLIVIYSIYSFIEIFLFQNIQGSKLNFKKI